jgi:hypothetical protein
LSRREYLILAVLAAASAVILAATGRFVPVFTPDTGGYLNLPPFPAVLGHPRTPLYGWLVTIVSNGSFGLASIPAIQISSYFAATFVLVAQLRRYGLSARATLSTGAALLFSNALLTVSHDVHPEFPAITCALLAVAGTVHLATPYPRWWGWLLVCAGTAFAYIMRPSLLPLVAALPALFVALLAIQGLRLALARAVMIFVVTILPFAGVASLRAATVGDPNIASFGGYVMSGMAILMLSDEVVARLPAERQSLARELLAARRSAEESGKAIGVPLNVDRQRSYHSTALAYFDVFARTHDDMLHLAASTRMPGEDWVEFNRRLLDFSLAVVRAAPDRYAVWLVGATTRLVGRSLVTNLPAILAILVVALAWPWRLLAYGEVGTPPDSRRDLPVMIILALAWLAAAGVLTVVIHAPANRFIDTSCLLVAPPLIYWASLLLRPNASGSGARA